MPRSFTFVLLLVIGFILLVAPVLAQDSPVSYVVISNQPANVRACPRLDCAIVDTLSPGAVVIAGGITTGDTVSSSDQWIQIDLDGKTAYVHSSLVEMAEAPSAAANGEQTSAADEEPNVVNTSHWVEHSGHGFSLMAPPSWMEIGAYVQDEEYWDDYAQVYGVDAAKNHRAWSESLYQASLDGTYEMVIKDPFGSGLLVIANEPTNSSIVTRDVGLEMLRSGSEAIDGEIIELTPVDLPAGEGIHISVRSGGALEDNNIIFTADSIFNIKLRTGPLNTTQYSGWAAAIAQSFHLEARETGSSSAT